MKMQAIAGKIFRGVVLLFIAATFWQCETENTIQTESQPEEVSQKRSAQTTFQAYDKPPTPVGGFAAIQQSLEYPEIARRAGIEGRVVLNILVDQEGSIESVKVLKSLGDNGCDEAAIQAVKAVDWQPATQNGNPVRVWVGLPVIFKIDGGAKKAGQAVAPGNAQKVKVKTSKPGSATAQTSKL